jgi:hypothetical protein
MSDSTTLIPLTPAQKQTWLDAATMLARSPFPEAANPEADPHKRVYVVSFDGTWNDRDHLPAGEMATNPAQLEKMVAQHYDGEHLAGKYYPGVGTQQNRVLVAVDGATGFSAGQVAESAYLDFEKQAKTWIAEDAHSNIEVVVMGFSRGSASARHFMNLVDERGIPASTLPGLGMGGLLGQPVSSDYLRKPGSIGQEALLYDTVATGQEHFLKLGIPASVESVVHLTAQNENRVSFPLLSAKSPHDGIDDRRVLEIGLAGAHSDIGGSYPTGPDRMARYLGEVTLGRFGLPVTPEKAPIGALDEGMHDSQWGATKYVKPLEEAFHGPGREVQVVQAPTALDSVLQNVTEAAQRASVTSDAPPAQAIAPSLSRNRVETVEVTNDGKGQISVLSSVSDTHLDLPKGTLTVQGDVVKLTPEDLAAINHGNGIIFNIDREHHATRESPASASFPGKPVQGGHELSR